MSDNLHIHDLDGCAATPLAHYLKALAILRLVAEQKDPDARGWWEGDRFRLATRLDRDALQRFFLYEYQPTPLIAPWNRGAGFFKMNDPALTPIERSESPRFAAFRDGIAAARKIIHAVGVADAVVRAIKDRTKTDKTFQSDDQRRLLLASEVYRESINSIGESLKKAESDIQKKGLEDEKKTIESIVAPAEGPPTRGAAERLKRSKGYKRLLATAERHFKDHKATLIPDCRREWRGPHADWMSAAVVVGVDGKPMWPSLLGSGGNEGNLDYTNNFMQRLGVLFDLSQPEAPPNPDARASLEAAMFSQPNREFCTGTTGQFLPGHGGGDNSSTGFEGKPTGSSWDYLLSLEGTVMFAASLVRRAQHDQLPKATAPFAVAGSATGHGSTAEAEGNARGEQWMPLWEQPTTKAEVESLLAEGRSQVHRNASQRPLDMARAIGRLGVARGISSFERYSFIVRKGDSNLAVPLGRWDVPTQPTPHADLLDDVAQWVDAMRRAGQGKGAPGSLGRAARQCEEAMLACCRPSASGAGDSRRWCSLLLALGEAEAQLVRSPKTTAEANLKPLPSLRPQWITAAAGAGTDQDRELRLALAIAGLHGWAEHEGRMWRDPIRRHLLPLDECSLRKGRVRFAATERTLRKDPAVVVAGLNGEDDLIAVLRRRVMEAGRGEVETKHLPLRPARGLTAAPADLAAVVQEEVDLGVVLALARPLMALNWNRWRSENHEAERREIVRRIAAPPPTGDDWGTLGLYGLFKLCHHHASIEIDGQEFKVPLDSHILPRLLAGDLNGAAERGKRRLRASELLPVLGLAAGNAALCRRLAATLVFPISTAIAGRLAGFLTNPEKAKGADGDRAAALEPDAQPVPHLEGDAP